MADYTLTVDDVSDTTVLVVDEISTVNITVSDPGVAGPPGPPNTLSIGTVTTGTASANITGIAPNQILNLVYPLAARFVHTQGTTATTWTINHTLGGYPSVTIVDSGQTVVFGEINYASTSQVVVNFTSAFSGFAYLT